MVKMIDNKETHIHAFPKEKIIQSSPTRIQTMTYTTVQTFFENNCLVIKVLSISVVFVIIVSRTSSLTIVFST